MGFIRGRFISRPNRFTAIVELGDGREVRAYVADPGRLGELLYPGNEVLLRPKEGGKLRYQLMAAKKDGKWVLVDSGLHNYLAELVLPSIPYLSTFRGVEREVGLGDSRIDFKLDGYWLEVKGCTLIRGRIAYFPDAPTSRGLRQVRALKGLGEAGILFLIMADADLMALNFQVDPAFSREVASSGLDLFAYAFEFDGEALEPKGIVPTTREEEPEAILDFLYGLREAVEAYNETHGPEAHYDILEVNSDSFTLALTGYASCSCCLFDYLDDILYEADLGDWRVGSWRARRGQYLIRYRRAPKP